MEGFALKVVEESAPKQIRNFRVIEYKVDILYNLIGKGIEWTLREFEYINQALNLNLTISDMDEAFE